MCKSFVALSNFVLCQLLLLACVTGADPKKAAKNYENCLCGPTFDVDGRAQCAIWGEAKITGQATKVWQSQTKPNCEPQDCSQLFSKFCEKIQMWPYPPVTVQPAAANQNCFCDLLLVENNKGQVQSYCAAWVEDSKNIIEYHSLDDCSPTRCQTAPFEKSAKICNNRFKTFYAPLLNHK